MNLKNIAKKGTVCSVLRMGNPDLLKTSTEVDVESVDAMNIIHDMAATIESIGEIAGLAANQIGYRKRVIFYQVVASRADEFNPKGVPPSFLINPYYKPVGKEKITRWEACLSTPGIAAEVERYATIHLTAIGWNGEEFYSVDRLAHGYEARVLQHEIDHLDGIVYVLKRKTPQGIAYIEEAKQFHM